jgi:3',5'-nucleoside bisphosphate phosphatase
VPVQRSAGPRRTAVNMRVDLHLHSTASDGSLSPAALIPNAIAGGLDVIALTDHDTIGGLAEAAQAGAGCIHVIPGIEISTNQATAEIHILGYFIDPGNSRLRQHETSATKRRRDRMCEIIDALRPAGIDVDITQVIEAAGTARIIARPHLARVLVQRGYATNVSDAFDRWIGNESTAFRPVNLVSPELAIEIIHEAGGIAVWAHPDITRFRTDARQFADAGLDGVECFRPRCSADESLELERSALGLGLLPTGGSDWHGPWSGRLGSFALGRDEIGAFLERGGI